MSHGVLDKLNVTFHFLPGPGQVTAGPHLLEDRIPSAGGCLCPRVCVGCSERAALLGRPVCG